jgi:uncharacterized lipoprotein YmbA
MRIPIWRPAGLAICSAVALLAGCASTPEPQLLSLPLPATAPDSQPDAQASSMLVVRRINIPEYLQTPRVRYRAADSVLADWPNVVWAERLESGLTDHLQIRLRSRLPGWTVCERACPPGTRAYVLTVDLSPLDHVRAARELRAQAHWQIIRRGDRGNAVYDGMRNLALPVAPDSAQGQAQAMARMLDALAQDIAAQLAALPSQPSTAFETKP